MSTIKTAFALLILLSLVALTYCVQSILWILKYALYSAIYVDKKLTTLYHYDWGFTILLFIPLILLAFVGFTVQWLYEVNLNFLFKLANVIEAIQIDGMETKKAD